MKKIYIIILVSALALLATKIANAQIVDGVNYQAVALDENGKEIAGMDIDGNILYEKTIAVRFSIIDASVDGELLYQETHETNTDMYGLFNVIIGH